MKNDGAINDPKIEDVPAEETTAGEDSIVTERTERTERENALAEISRQFRES